jgi:hypothetical protein
MGPEDYENWREKTPPKHIEQILKMQHTTATLGRQTDCEPDHG